MEKSWRNRTHRVHAGLGLFLLLVGVSSAATASHSHSDEISTRDLLELFHASNLETARDPITFQGRNGTRSFLNWRLNAIVSSSGDQTRNSVELQTFQTKMFESSNRERVVDGVNYLAIFRGKNMSHDVPLIILANYDTDDTEENPVDDNGSGIIALVALAEHVSHQIRIGKLDLERTLIFAATDVALSKYKHGVPVDSPTGAEALVRQWLTSFLQGRQGFAGAIVLDSIMHFKDEANTQAQYDGLISKAFPYAYQEISKRNFKGDFLAMVYRDGEMDSPLAKSFSRGWKSANGRRGSGGEVEINPGLIHFMYENSTFNQHAPSVVHFLQSEQSSFWNKFPTEMRRTGSRKELPALLLTDTGKYRPNECTSSGCTIRKMVLDSPKNVEFLRRTTNALYATIKELQVVGYQNSSPRTESYSTLAVILGSIVLHRLFL